MKNDLKACPFCGGEAVLINPFIFGRKCVSVWCILCKAKTDNFFADSDEKSKKHAIRAWNRRVSDD